MGTPAQWTPDPAALSQILATIHASTDMSPAVQRSITQKLNSYSSVPSYIGYLAWILVDMPQEEERIRSIAGYLLKNNARLILQLDTASGQFGGQGQAQDGAVIKAYVKSSILRAFGNAREGAMIRNTAGQDPKHWPECLEVLVGMLDLDGDMSESAFNVLEKACEDYPRKLDVEINGTRPLDFMIPKFLALTDHPSSKMRAHAVACLSYFVPANTPALFAHLDAFIASLFRRASDDDPSVRRHVCQALVLLLAARPERLMPEMANVAEYMLYSTRDSNEHVALEACEFWLTFAEDGELASYLAPLLGRVAPVLLDCMVYGEDDLLWLDGGEEEDQEQPDREEDIKPRFYGGKAHGFERDEADGKDKMRYGAETFEDDDDFDDYDDDDFGDDMSTEWNLRKCAAAALDVLAVRFTGELLNVLLGPLKEKLWNQDWLQRESGILALGAMAEGCIEAIEPHLPVLVPYLINTLNDPKPLVRSITCWTLGRYASWCTQNISVEHKQTYFIPTMEGLLRMVLDSNKRVQEAGCSAFATLEEDAGAELAPFLEPVLRNLVLAFGKYQSKNMALGEPMYVEILMPPLTGRWARLKDDDADLIPLLECLASVSIAMGASFLPYAGPVFQRCTSLIHNALLQYQSWQQHQSTHAESDMDEPDKAFLVVALDLLSGLTQGLGGALETFVRASEGQHGPNLLALLTVCLKHPQAAVRQSGYALVGDMAMGCFGVLRPAMAGIMQELVGQLDPEPKFDFVSASNNAAWSVGEVALRYGRDDPEFATYVPPLIARLIPILLHPKAPRSLHENAAVSIGRIGLMHPGLVAPHLAEFAQAWCQALYEIRDNEEKDSAFRGLCTMVEVNPGGIAKSLLWFCNSIVRWNAPSPELNGMFQTLLSAFKAHDQSGWAAQVQAFPPVIQERLAQRYGV
ncbi:armadillo-type protein [Mucidula mucida]|nr:armadillo-type protein [Mucidula mucida]